ncbi:MAG: tetratricopeptide repeat protein [Myxococcota bacterium]
MMGALYAGGDLWPREDPLLHTTVLRAPVPHEWLFQVALHGVQQAFGFAGLRVVHTLAVAAIVVGVWRCFRGASRDATAAALATLVLVALSWFRFMQLRPDVLSALFTVGLYAWVLRPDAGPDRRHAVAALAGLLVWVNAHSLFAVGLCLVVAALLGCGLHAGLARFVAADARDVADDRRRGVRLLAFFAAALLVTWWNPRGFDQHLTFFIESDAGLIWKIQDDFLPWRPWSPPDGAGPAFTPLAWALANLLYGAFLLAAGVRLARFARRRDAASLETFDAVHFGLGLAACVASLVAVRFHWLAFFPLLYLLRPLAERPLPGGARAATAALATALALWLPVSAGAVAFRAEVAREPLGYWRAPWLDVRYCGAGMRFLVDAGLEGRLYHPFNLGGFLGYHAAPRLRTFIDGRLDHVPPAVLNDYLTIRRTSRRGPTHVLQGQLDRWGIDLFFADTFPEPWYADRESGQHLRRLPEWMPVFVARTHAVYLRRNPRNRANAARVARYWAAQGVPHDPRRGHEVAAVIREAPERAAELGLRLPADAALRARPDDPDALEALAAHAWRVGDFADQVALDERLVRLRPEARDPAFRLADGLYHLGRVHRAHRRVEALLEEHPRDLEALALAPLVANRVGIPFRSEQTD